MRVALVAMPWPDKSVPCPALGALAGYLRQEMPEVELTCRSEYMSVAGQLDLLYDAICRAELIGEPLYVPHLFPAQRAKIRALFQTYLDNFPDLFGEGSDKAKAWELVFETTAQHIEDTAQELAVSADLVGFTTTYAQIFSSLAVAKRLKELNPDVPIVLGGLGVASKVGPSVLQTFSFVDFVVQGEGELRLRALIEALESGDTSLEGAPGILSRASLDRALGDISESPLLIEPPSELLIDDLDTLPFPDYSEYQERAEAANMLWTIPIEGSRGCWWNRSSKTGDPMHACHFCRQSKRGYTEKSAERVASEMLWLSERHQNLRFAFLDDLQSRRSLEGLTEAIRSQGRRYRFFYEVRASVTPWQLLCLKNAGCRAVQIGVEGLSSSYLKRIGKGTTVIHNLQAMRICFELEIDCLSNLLTRFPGSTREEVAETIETIQRAAIAYQPLRQSWFGLPPDCAVATFPERFGITNVRNHDEIAGNLPTEIAESLDLWQLSFDEIEPPADWSEAEHLLEAWQNLHDTLDMHPDATAFQRNKPLYYSDGGSFIEIIDKRRGLRAITLVQPGRELYLYCTQIRTRKQIVEYLDGQLDAEDVSAFLEAYVEAGIMFAEGNRFLSLAVDLDPENAAKRISEFKRQP